MSLLTRPAFTALCLCAGIATLFGARLTAHDLWIEPTSFQPEAGKVVGVRLRVGQDLLGDPVPRDPALIDQFVLAGPDGRSPIAGRDGADPAGLVRLTRPGLHIIGYRSQPSPITLAAAKFNQYLMDEGLDAVIAARAAHGQSNADARERFARCAKSLVSSGGAPPDAGGAWRDHPLGFTLELIAEQNPYTLQPGADFPVRLLYENRPLQNALVVAVNRQDPMRKLTARSDKDGRVTFHFAKPGFWLIKTVHMVPAAAETDADWLSYWASLTFETRTPVSMALAK